MLLNKYGLTAENCRQATSIIIEDLNLQKKFHTVFPAFVQVTKQICDAVAMLHRPFPPIVHCDIKEENIIIDNNDYVVKIIDFDAAYIEGSGSYNMVRSTKGYRPTEMVNAAPVAQSDIYAIGCIMENIMKYSDWKSKLDSQCNEKLNQIIIKSKEELNRRYYDVNELKAALSEVEILYMLQCQMSKLHDTDTYNVYSYSNDRKGIIDIVKENLIKYSDIDILYVACLDIQNLAFSKTGIYNMRGNLRDKNLHVDFITYDELVACVRIKTENEFDTLACITRSFSGQWKTHELQLPTVATDIICEILNNIVLFKNSYYSKERIAGYYSNKCLEANDILTRKELEGKAHELDIWWDLVINLGKLACDKEQAFGFAEYSCKDILLKVYANKRSDLQNVLREHKYSDEQCYDEILDCYESEIKLGDNEAEKKMEEFKRKVEQKQSDDKGKQPKMLEAFAKRFVDKKEEE